MENEKYLLLVPMKCMLPGEVESYNKNNVRTLNYKAFGGDQTFDVVA